uniref:Uncharacterized protein n=1 Tax=Plectus sambesii TaxID=2011161 RepID=A0A914W3T7_9BILA
MQWLTTVIAVVFGWSVSDVVSIKPVTVDDVDGVIDSRLVIAPDDWQVASRSRQQPDLMCYTCMSKNIPDVTKAILAKTINMNESAQTDACNDPFNHHNATKFGVMMQPCDTACMKVASENRCKPF